MPDYGQSDEHLLQASGRGDLDAFSRIVQRHQDWGWRIAHRFTGDEAEAADIVQDAFLRLLKAAGRYRPTARFKTYFYCIISRLCMDRAKKKHPQYLDTAPDSPDHGLNATQTLLDREKALAIRAALDLLPPNQRMAMILKYYEDLGYKEIAQALEITPKAVERLLARARQTLRTRLREVSAN